MVNVGKTKQESLAEGGFFFSVFYLIIKNSGKLQIVKTNLEVKLKFETCG